MEDFAAEFCLMTATKDDYILIVNGAAGQWKLPYMQNSSYVGKDFNKYEPTHVEFLAYIWISKRLHLKFQNTSSITEPKWLIRLEISKWSCRLPIIIIKLLQ